MSFQGYDYTNASPGTIKADGGRFVVRYLGTTGKCIGPHERDALHADGITVGLVRETTGVTYRGGHAAGLTDGAAAQAAGHALGLPAGALVWFAIDEDATDYKACAAYLQGCQAGAPSYAARLYAKYAVLEYVGGTDHWQTYAWSSGKESKHASLYQYHNGASLDRDETINGGPTFRGGWMFPGVPAPAPVPGPVKRHWWNPRSWHLDATTPVVDAAALADVGKAIDHNLCLVFVRTLYGLPADGHSPTAAVGWAHAKYKHPGDTNPPPGVPVWWTGGTHGAGHVAVSIGGGKVVSSDIGPGGTVAAVPLAEIHAKWGLTYAGWSEDIESKRVYTP